jgi:MFS family permease
VLRDSATWRLILSWACAYGLTAGVLEATLATLVPDVPVRPWHALFRTVQALMWTVGAAIAIALAERWPVHSRRDWRRAVAQVAVGLIVGPAWGVIGYSLADVFMPWRRAAGVWGIIAIDAKGMLFAYGITVAVAHVVLRAREQRARAVAVSQLQARAAEAHVRILTLELQSDGVLAAMDRIIERAERDPVTANEMLVELADRLGAIVEETRTRSWSQENDPHRVDQGVRDRRRGNPTGSVVHPTVR